MRRPAPSPSTSKPASGRISPPATGAEILSLAAYIFGWSQVEAARTLAVTLAWRRGHDEGLEYIYRDSAGVAIGTITRIDNKDGTKTFRASAGFPSPRPLYNLHLLDEYPEDPVWWWRAKSPPTPRPSCFPNWWW